MNGPKREFGKKTKEAKSLIFLQKDEDECRVSVFLLRLLYIKYEVKQDFIIFLGPS